MSCRSQIFLSLSRAAILGMAVVALAGCGINGWFSRGSEPLAVPPLAKGEKQVSIEKGWQARLYGDWRLDPYNMTQIQATAHGLVLSDNGDRLISLGEAGRQRWIRRLDGKSARGPAVSGGIVYIGTDAGKMYALKAANGQILWKQQLDSEILSVPVVAGGHVLVQLANGHLLSIDAGTGMVQWTFSMTQPSLILRTAAAPLVKNGIVYAGFADGSVVALGLQNGAELWRATVAIPHGNNELARMVDVAATPVAYHDSVIAASYQGSLVAFGLQGGAQRWSVPMSVVLTPLLVNGRLYVAEADGRIAAVDPRSGVVLWQNDRLRGRNLGGFAYCAGDLVATDTAGYVYVLDPKSGHRIGQRQISSSGIESQPACTNGQHIVVMDAAGTLYQLHLHRH